MVRSKVENLELASISGSRRKFFAENGIYQTASIDNDICKRRKCDFRVGSVEWNGLQKPDTLNRD